MTDSPIDTPSDNPIVENRADRPGTDARPQPRPAVRDDLAAMEGYHSAQVTVDVRLNTNEAPQLPPPGFVRAVSEAAMTLAWNRYPDRFALRLRTKIGARFGFGPEQVFCANGSNEVLQTVLLTYAGSGRRTLTFEPTYALHQHLSRITGSDPVMAERDQNYQLDPAVVGAAIAAHRPSITFLCSPNNPTGLVERRETVEAALAAVEKINGLLVVDEAYGEFSTWSAVELLDLDRPLVVSKTFSKTWAMAGARLGYLLGPKWLIADLEMVVLPYHLDGLKQAAGEVALDFVDEMAARISRTVEQRGRIEAALGGLGCEVWPSGANFILFRPHPGSDGQFAEMVWQGLVDRSVLVRDTSSWDRLDGCLRVTVGTAEENGRFLDALTDILGDR